MIGRRVFVVAQAMIDNFPNRGSDRCHLSKAWLGCLDWWQSANNRAILSCRQKHTVLIRRTELDGCFFPHRGDYVMLFRKYN